MAISVENLKLKIFHYSC